MSTSPPARPPVRSATTQLPVVEGALSVASLRPLGVGLPGAHPWRVFLETARDNLDALDVAWDILAHGVCDRSSLGVAGLHDGLPGGFHIDPHRAEHLRRHTQPALAPADLLDIGRLTRLDAGTLAHLGRLAHPYIRRPGDRGFERVRWDDALDAIQESVPKPRGKRMAFIAGADGLSIETAYHFAKTARLLASAHVDLCPSDTHDAVEAALDHALGLSRATASTEDLLDAQLILVAGSQLAKADGRAVSLLLAAKRKGARVVVINPLREPSLSHVWTGNDLRSALLGTRLTDDFVEVAAGGDPAFFTGVNKAIVERQGHHTAFVDQRTDGFADLQATLSHISWDDLEAAAGCPRRDMEWVAELAVRADRAVTLIGTGLSRGPGAQDAVGAILDLHLLRGWMGHDGSGVLPLASSAGTLGARAVGLHPARLPGGVPVGPGTAAMLSGKWGGHFIPAKAGHASSTLADAATHLDLLVSLGADPFVDLPHPSRLSTIPVRVHLDTVVRPSMLEDAGQLVVLLPIAGFYAQRGGSTILTADHRIRFSPTLDDPTHDIRQPHDALHALAARLDPDIADALEYTDTAAIRTEVAEHVDRLEGIAGLHSAGDWVQPGGRHAGTETAFPGGRARFTAPALGERPPLHVVARKGPPVGTGGRDTILLSAPDATPHGIHTGDHVEVSTEHGTYTGEAHVVHMPPGAVHVCMPEASNIFAAGPRPHLVAVTLRRRP